MSKIKVLYQHTIMITSGILFVVAIEGLLMYLSGNGNEFSLSWYHPISMFVAGILSSIPSLVLNNYEDFTTQKFLIRLLIHCLLVYSIVMIMGYFFVWYHNWIGFAYVSMAFFVVYVLVWVSSIWMFKQDDVKINAALKDIQDEE